MERVLSMLFYYFVENLKEILKTQGIFYWFFSIFQDISIKNKN